MRARTSTRSSTPVALLYVRVSAMDSQSDSDNSLENQTRVLTAAAAADGFTETRVVLERHSASRRLPAREAALADLDAGKATALYVHKVDRLSRMGAADVLRVAERADRRGWRLRVLDCGMDTGTTVGRLVLTILAAVARMESERRSERMREYHGERRARGQQQGQHYGPRPGSVPRASGPDTERRVAAMRTAGHSLRAIARTLDAEQVDGRRWHPATVARVLERAA